MLQLCEELEIAGIEAYYGNQEASPTLILSREPFLAAIRAEKPRAIYWFEFKFDLVRFIESEMGSEGWEEEFDEDETNTRFPTVEAIRERLQLEESAVAAQTGKAYYLCAMFPGAGANRVAKFQTLWSSNLEDAIGDLIDEHREERSNIRQRALLGNTNGLEKLAIEIAAHPEFLATRGLPKRYALVAKLFKGRIPPHPTRRMSRAVEHVPDADVNLELVVKMAQDIAREQVQSTQS
ncbi:hypothetical protein HK44_019680 [Pseudomonas fluorescens HK44]|uniref:Uncharacterized protein n=1 Tax=Pseudomonas fluorescens HK44 TaxID=1042209 RepID=A0A010SIH6_PSEFL|nr:hypothetical protein [Pseudomonas fluorescens]EXF91103.1 hypothetical protein HK44_019680 [Pseudomonas fluorescens HK44]